MPAKKNRYNESDILEAAFSVVRKHGWGNCTARSIAKELGSSTMPIYSYVKSMADLKKKIVQKAVDLMLRYQSRYKTNITFLDMGLGYVSFAKEEQNLFKLLFHDTAREQSDDAVKASTHKTHNIFKPFNKYAFDSLLGRLADSESLEGFPKEEKAKVLYKAWIFSHGLAVLINNGIISDLGSDEIVNLLKETGICLIEGTKQLTGREQQNE